MKKQLDDLSNEDLIAALTERLRGEEPDRDPGAGKSLARQFACLYDEQQADFFEECGRIFASWAANNGESQIISMARHMKTCECVSDLGREFVFLINDVIKDQL